MDVEQAFSNIRISDEHHLQNGDSEKQHKISRHPLGTGTSMNDINGHPEAADGPTNGAITFQQKVDEIERTQYHFPKLPVFVDKLKEAYACRELKKTDSYKNVFALLIQWEDDDLGVEREIEQLEEMLRVTYRFNTKTWLIPSGKERYTELFQTVSSFLAKDADDTLFLFYYGGHAYQDVHSQPIWFSNRDRGLEYKSSTIFPLFEELQGDVLLLFDACQALPHDFDCHGNGIVAALTATGFEPGIISAAAGVGSDSFTSALIEELGILSRPEYPSRKSQPFSHLTLYSRLVSRLRLSPRTLGKRQDGTWKRDANGHHTLQSYQRRTPVHHFLSRNKEHRPIMLSPLSNDSSAQVVNDNYNAEYNDEYNDERPVPCVLVSIRLKPSTLKDADIDPWVKWLNSLPKDAQAIEIEGREFHVDAVYESHSTLVVLKLPLEIWSLIQNDPAMSFIGYVYGENRAQNVNKRISQKRAFARPRPSAATRKRPPTIIELTQSTGFDASDIPGLTNYPPQKEQNVRDKVQNQKYSRLSKNVAIFAFIFITFIPTTFYTPPFELSDPQSTFSVSYNYPSKLMLVLLINMPLLLYNIFYMNSLSRQLRIMMLFSYTVSLSLVASSMFLEVPEFGTCLSWIASINMMALSVAMLFGSTTTLVDKEIPIIVQSKPSSLSYDTSYSSGSARNVKVSY